MNQKKVKTITEDGREVEALAPMILSVSRATDIPAFYSEWFFHRLEKGYCRWRNPFNGLDSYVSFQNVRFIVFWSKNPAALIPYLVKLRKRGIRCYIQYTLNDYETENLEPGVPSLDCRVNTFKKLAELLGNNGVVWRFDPLMLTDRLSIDNLLCKIEGLGNKLNEFTETLIFSFADISSYRRVGTNLRRSGVNYREWSETDMKEFAERLSGLNARQGWNFRLATCGEKIDLHEFGISHNRCIDDELIARIAWEDEGLMKHLGIEIHTVAPNIFGEVDIPNDVILLDAGQYAIRTRRNRDAGQRKYCGCITAKDIGQYNTCPHGCLYCYANTSPESAQERYESHQSETEMITV